VLMLMYLINKG